LSGLRLSESLEFYWDRLDKLCVDLSQARPMLRIPEGEEKGNADRLLPMAPGFAEFLLAVPEAERFGRVFKLRGLRLKASPLPEWVSDVVSRVGREAEVVVHVNARAVSQWV
jgi:hypothetical protein